MNKILIASLMLLLFSAVFAENETIVDNSTLVNETIFDNSTLIVDNSTLVNDTIIDNSTALNETIIDNSTLPPENPELNDTVLDNSTLLIDNSTLPDNSTTDIEILSSNPGIVLRFSQLLRQINIRVEQANVIISQVNDSATAERLSLIVLSLESVGNEVNYYTDETKEYDLNQAAVDFVSLKKQSLDLVSEFKEISHNYFKESDIENLRNRIKSVNASDTLTHKISRMINAYNALKVKKMFSNLDNETVSGIMNGSIIKDEIKNIVRNKLENMNESEKIKAVLEIKENLVRNNINNSARNNEIVQNLHSAISKSNGPNNDNSSDSNQSPSNGSGEANSKNNSNKKGNSK